MRTIQLIILLFLSVPFLAASAPPILEPAPRIMLVTPGPSAPEFPRLAADLKTAGATTVMDASVLGSVDQLSDQAIIDLAASYPIDIVLIYRRMSESQAVVTRWNKASAEKQTEVLDLEVQKVEIPDVVPNAKVIVNTASISALTRAEEERAARRRGDYFRTLIQSPSDYVFVEGVDKTPVGSIEFYRRVGREDLAETYESNRRFGTILGVASGVMMAVGLGLGFVGVLSGAFDGVGRAQVMAGVGGGLFLVGGSGLIYVLTREVHPVSADETRELLDDFNAREQRRFGVPAPTSMNWSVSF